VERDLGSQGKGGKGREAGEGRDDERLVEAQNMDFEGIISFPGIGTLRLVLGVK
jgi:hypothetical protein